MSNAEVIVVMLLEVQGLLIALAIYPKLFPRRSPRS